MSLGSPLSAGADPFFGIPYRQYSAHRHCTSNFTESHTLHPQEGFSHRCEFLARDRTAIDPCLCYDGKTHISCTCIIICRRIHAVATDAIPVRRSKWDQWTATWKPSYHLTHRGVQDPAPKFFGLRLWVESKLILSTEQSDRTYKLTPPVYSDPFGFPKTHTSSYEEG